MSMGHKQRTKTGLTSKEIQRQRQRTTLAQEQSAEVDLEDQLEDDFETSETEEPEPEPPGLEDGGDSDGWFADKPLLDPFYSGPRRPLSTFAELPYEARPLVRYWIDHEFNVHKLDRKPRPRRRRVKMDPGDEATTAEPSQNRESVPAAQTEDLQSKRRDLIARAVATHLRQEKCELQEPGDWCKIPRIDGIRGLLELARRIEPETDDLGLHSVGRAVSSKNFAIMLPNGDVIAVQALLDEARKTKRATRAAALRVAKSRPFELAGDLWSTKDWNRFDTVQSQAEGEQEEGDSP